MFMLWMRGLGQVDVLKCEYKLGCALLAMRDEYEAARAPSEEDR